MLPGWQAERWGYQRQDGQARVEAHGPHGRWAVHVLYGIDWRLVKRNIKGEDRAMTMADAALDDRRPARPLNPGNRETCDNCGGEFVLADAASGRERAFNLNGTVHVCADFYKDW